jgi:uncharacterized protein (TIGR01777 family)
MKVVVTGASGLIGSALVPHLRRGGHEVVTLVRRAPRTPSEAHWDPARGAIDQAAIADVDAAVHLAGAGVGDHRWTDDYRCTILRSRVDGTTLLARTLASLDRPPRVLVSASGIDHYPDTDEELTEQSGRGTGFLADVTQAWEDATAPAQDAGITVACIRTGVVLAPRGGMMQRVRPLVRLGLAGPLGSGQQWWSWITLTDHVRAVTRLLDGDLAGPVNLSAPEPARQRDVMRALAAAAHRPAVLPVPAFAVRLALGGFAGAVLASHRVVPRRLLDAGFTFEHPDIRSAAGHVMG